MLQFTVTLPSLVAARKFLDITDALVASKLADIVPTNTVRATGFPPASTMARWSAEERTKLNELVAAHTPWNEISVALSRSLSSIKAQFYKDRAEARILATARR